MRLLEILFVAVGFFFTVWAYCICIPETAPWKSKEKRVAFWEKEWKDKSVWGVLSIAFAVLTPFMFYFILIHNYIPDGEYRVRVDVSGYNLPCDLIVETVETEVVERNGDTGTSYSKAFYLDMAYWPNGGQLRIDEYIDPAGDELEIYNHGDIYTVKTPQITQEFLKIDSYDLAKERLFNGSGILFMILEVAAVYVSVQFVSAVSHLQAALRENASGK